MQDAFRALPAGSAARSQDHNTLPWIHYHLAGGQMDGKELHACLCFYDQKLVYVRVTADLYPPGTKDWSHYSLDVEAATKQFHDQLLERILGAPSAEGIWHKKREGQAVLERPLNWRFDWGRVSSCHDSKGGGTHITISYGNRQDEASEAYSRRTTAG